MKDLTENEFDLSLSLGDRTDIAAFESGFDNCISLQNLKKDHRSTERLIGLGFRCWLCGIRQRDAGLFELCCNRYMQHFGTCDGILLSNELGYWTEALAMFSNRQFEILDGTALGFSRDEVVAVSMVAAAQHAECPALKSCIYAITQRAEFEHLEHATDEFASTLTNSGHILSSDAILAPLMNMAGTSKMKH